ncbi:hypothetical protein [Streptomyces sp. CB03238]|uniref:hypothetical protein n=1 Tax=Streptomyces sp. CB03238 TaxID=1907777 RepID=UPI001180FBDD|nr:hypothetical protein [Streptomyces sp. CB03238]
MRTHVDTYLPVLEEIASGKRDLPAVRHPLGFLCLPLLREGPDGVCVHLFGGDDRHTTDVPPLHAHSWELRSHVLYGEVGNVRVRIRDDTDTPTHRVFEVRSGPDGVDEIRPTARLVRGQEGPVRRSPAGETYALGAGEFHTTVVTPGRSAATLVLGRSLPGGRDLSLGPLDGPPRRTVRRLYGTEATMRAVRTALGDPSGVTSTRDVAGEFWHVVGMYRFQPGELDEYLPGVRRLPLGEEL